MDFISPLQNQGSASSQFAEQKIGRLKNEVESGNYKNQEELKELARQFESIFVNLLMKSMRATVPKDGMLSSFSMDMYQSMFDEEVANATSESEGKGLGLAEVLYSQLSRLNPEKPDAAGLPENAGPSSSSLKPFNPDENRL